MQSQIITIPIGGEQIATQQIGKTLPRVLSLHGAGTANQKLMVPIAEGLVSYGISTCTFDFSGYGQSSANSPISLKKRAQEAMHIYKHIAGSCDTLVAFSMSGYIALHLAQMHSSIKHLVLFAPALYDRGAFAVPFGSHFSSIIRTHESWKNSDVNSLLASYEGTIDIFIGENDLVIPDEVISSIYFAANKCADRRIHTLIGVEHRIAHTMNQNLQLCDAVVAMIARRIM